MFGPVKPPPVWAQWYFDSNWGTFWQIWGAIGALILAAWALLLAWRIARRQFRLMDEQGKVIDRQTAMLNEHNMLLDKIKDIGEEQRAILETQGAISERQHQILEAQLAKRSVLRVRCAGQHSSTDGLGENPVTTIIVKVKNVGTKSAEGFHWEVFIPDDIRGSVFFLDEFGNEIDGTFSPMSETDRYHKDEAHYVHKLFPWSDVDVTILGVRTQHVRAQEFAIKWRIRSEEGWTPYPNLGEIRFRKHDDWSYEILHVPLADDDQVQAQDGPDSQADDSQS